jgi:hypothetical protein
MWTKVKAKVWYKVINHKEGNKIDPKILQNLTFNLHEYKSVNKNIVLYIQKDEI